MNHATTNSHQVLSGLAQVSAGTSALLRLCCPACQASSPQHPSCCLQAGGRVVSRETRDMASRALFVKETGRVGV